MGGKGGKKRKGGGVPTPGFGAGGRGGPSGGLPSPSPTPSVGGWETEDARFGLGGGGVPSARETRPKVPRVGVASSVADVGSLAAEMSQLRLRMGGPGQNPATLLFNLVNTSGLALPVRRVLNELVEEVVECRVAAERAEVAKLRVVLAEDKVSADLASKLVEAERKRAEMEGLANQCERRLERFKEGAKVVDVEMKRLLQEGFDLRDEIERLKLGKVARGVDKGTRMSTVAVRPGFCLAGVQTEGAEVSTVGVMTDVTNVLVVRKTTYVSVASQASPEVVAGAAGVDVEMGGMGGGPSGPPPTPVGFGVPVPGAVRAQALLIHGVDCRRSARALLAAARGLRVGECEVRGVRWLLGVGRRWGKRLSSVVVYLDRLVVVRGHSLWFGGALHPVERYVFGR